MHAIVRISEVSKMGWKYSGLVTPFLSFYYGRVDFGIGYSWIGMLFFHVCGMPIKAEQQLDVINSK